MKGKRGFTLLEMLVASTIMAIAIVGLLSSIAGATHNASRLREYDRAVALARLRMNELLADDTVPPGGLLSGDFDPSLTGGMAMGWQARMTTVEPPPNAAVGQPELQRIELQVWWMSGPNKRTFTLDAHRTHLLRPGDL